MVHYSKEIPRNIGNGWTCTVKIFLKTKKTLLPRQKAF